MRILFCKWGSVCEAMVERGLQELQVETDLMTQVLKHTDYDTEYLKALANRLDKSHYDCVFSVNFVPIISKVCNLYKIKYICQTVDSPSLQLYSKDLANPCNHVFMFDRCQYRKFYPVNPKGVFYLPLGCDVPYYEQISATKEEHRKYDCDVSFIGSTYQEKCKYNQIENLPDYMKGYVDGLIHAQLNLYGYNLIEDSLTEAFCREFKRYADWGTLPKDYEEDISGLIADTYIGEKCTEQERIATLKNISEHFHMDIYTASDMSMIPKIHNKGIADTYTMMPQIFQCSRINLNMTNRPIKSGLPQRIFDICGAGGFLLTNYQAELPEYFEIGREIAVYESQEDLVEKIAYYLEHEDERKEIALAGRKAVQERHRYSFRLKMMFDTALG